VKQRTTASINSSSRVSGKGNLKEIQDCFTLLVIIASEKGDMTES
jgi:hypothetical protein